MLPSYLLSTSVLILFFFTDTPPTEIYTLSLHDALPIFFISAAMRFLSQTGGPLLSDSDSSSSNASIAAAMCLQRTPTDRKSTRLNSSHMSISYAVFCLKKKKKKKKHRNVRKK